MTVISDKVNQFLAATPDPLIRYGRYQIVPDGELKAKPHTRITNYARKLEDEYNLTLWKQRMVLLGAAQRSDITTAALAAHDDKRELDQLADAAMDAAKANVSRETGSALHKLCERRDQGETMALPKHLADDVDAYVACVAAMKARVTHIEEVVVLPNLTLAGRFDRILNIGETLFIADLKTGADLSYSWGSIAIQLALYAAGATIYDPDTRKHSPMPNVDQSRALVLHLPAGKATCTPYWVNIEAGRAGIALIQEVLDWRKSSKMLATSAVNPKFVARPDLREYVAARMRYVIENDHGDELVRGWPEGVPTLKSTDDHTEAQLDGILYVCDSIEERHKMRFPDLVDPRIGKF